MMSDEGNARNFDEELWRAAGNAREQVEAGFANIIFCPTLPNKDSNIEAN